MPKVLVVDDAPVIRLLLKRVLHPLEVRGVELLFADDGYEALTIIERERPALVFLDIMMTGKSGFDVCETVKGVWGFEDVHIVFLSARVQLADKELGVLLGGEGYITKPFNPGEVLAKAQELLGLEE